MSKRLYFDCPIQAIYMIKEFGVVCELNESFLSEKQNGNYLPLSELLYMKKIYITPESEHIFEPKEGDIGKYVDNDFLSIALCDGEDWIEETGGLVPQKYYITFMRDNKLFFMPKEEV